MIIQEIKALPRTEEGIFDLQKVQADAGCRNIYQAADLVYPTYAAYETTENKKEGYPDTMAQMRVLKSMRRANSLRKTAPITPPHCFIRWNRSARRSMKITENF